MANTRITQGVIKPNEDYDVRHINATGIITAPTVNVTGVLTYEDVTNVDSVGLITARKGIISTGVVTATAFHGSGASLTGIDATALKDTGGNVKVQAQASGAIHTGISTFDTIKVGSGVTIESNGQPTFSGITTFAGNINLIGELNTDTARIRLPDGMNGGPFTGNLEFGNSRDFVVLHDGHHNLSLIHI